MLRKSVWLLAGIVLLAALPATAGKVGFVDVEKAASTVKQGQQAIVQFEKWAKPRRQRLAALKAAAEKAAQQYVKEQGVASDDVLEKLQKQAVDAKRRFEDAVRQFNRDAGAKRDALLNAVASRMKKVINDYAQSHGFDAVLVFKPGTIIYLSRDADLTDTIIRLYDQRFPPVQPTPKTTLPGLGKKRRPNG